MRDREKGRENEGIVLGGEGKGHFEEGIMCEKLSKNASHSPDIDSLKSYRQIQTYHIVIHTQTHTQTYTGRYWKRKNRRRKGESSSYILGHNETTHTATPVLDTT
jgi:hypothetical protein